MRVLFVNKIAESNNTSLELQIFQSYFLFQFESIEGVMVWCIVET